MRKPPVNTATLSRFLTIDVGGSGLKAAVVKGGAAFWLGVGDD